jgi:hypothetical protein
MNLNARNSDPSTSHAAADGDDVKRQDRARVWAEFLAVEPRPLADFQLEERLGGANNGKWRKRRSDLSRDEWLVAAGKVQCPHTGREQLQWKVNRPEREAAKPRQGDLFGE